MMHVDAFLEGNQSLSTSTHTTLELSSARVTCCVFVVPDAKSGCG
jgi:hypothetical protein